MSVALTKIVIAHVWTTQQIFQTNLFQECTSQGFYKTHPLWVPTDHLYLNHKILVVLLKIPQKRLFQQRPTFHKLLICVFCHQRQSLSHHKHLGKCSVTVVSSIQTSPCELVCIPGKQKDCKVSSVSFQFQIISQALLITITIITLRIHVDKMLNTAR